MKPVTFDGWLIVLLAGLPGVIAALGSDEASKFIDPATLWILRNSFAVFGMMLGALKGYRSVQYSQYKNGGGPPQDPKDADKGTTPLFKV